MNLKNFLKYLPDPSLAGCLLLAALVAVLSVAITHTCICFQVDKERITRAILDKGKDVAHRLNADIASTGVASPPILQSLIAQDAADPQIAYVCLTDPAGRIVLHSNATMLDHRRHRDLAGYSPAALPEPFAIVNLPDTSEQILEIAASCVLPTTTELAPPAAGPVVLIPSREKFDQRGARYSVSSMPLGPPNNLRPDNAPGLLLVGLYTTELQQATRHFHFQLTALLVTLILSLIASTLHWTRQRRALKSDQALSSFKAFSSLLVSKLPIGVIATDIDGKIITFNHAAGIMTDTDTQKAWQCRPETVLPAMLSGLLTRPAANDRIIEREIIFHAHDKTIPLHINSAPILDQDGELKGRVLLLDDVTDVKELQKTVQQQEKLAAMGKMAAGVAHEVRNPLNSIRGLAIMLGMKFKEESKEREAAELLVEEVDRLNRCVTELLQYSKPLYLKRQQTDINQLLNNSIHLMAPELAAGKVECRFSPTPDLPTIMADQDRIRQVTMNILLNACQAMPDGGRLEICTRPGIKSDGVEICMRDNGCGIAQEDLQKILDPYFTTKPTGSGLGLSMADKIIREHGGTLRIQSEIGRGTAVTISLNADLHPMERT